MYNIIKNVIDGGRFDLSTAIKKINKLWAEDEFTDEQRDELIAAARGGASVRANVDVLEKLEELDRRIKTLENSGTTETPAEDYPDFVVGKWYYNGDTCTFEGKKYTCIAPSGAACVWSPTDYPAYWELVK